MDHPQYRRSDYFVSGLFSGILTVFLCAVVYTCFVHLKPIDAVAGLKVFSSSEEQQSVTKILDLSDKTTISNERQKAHLGIEPRYTEAITQISNPS